MKWVTMWGNAQSTVAPHPATYAKDLTLRYPIYVPFGGNKIRIELDNYCCNEACTIDRVSVSVANKLNDEINENHSLSFNGNKEAYIKAHGRVKSDELNLDLNENDYLIVTMYIKDFTNLTSGVYVQGPLSKGYYAYGNQLDSKVLDINTSKSTNWLYFLSNIDIYTEDRNYAVICYGDSITSQDWPDYMQLAYKEMGVRNVSVIRKAVSGTRILREYNCITYQSYGLCGKKRFNHEVGSVCGAKKIIIQQGINDIIHPVGYEVNKFRPMSDMPTLGDLKEGLKYYINESYKYGLDVHLGTLLPIYNWRTYNSDKEDIKNAINGFIRSDRFIDFEMEVGHFIGGAVQFNDGCDSGDHLHPSSLAYEKMGKLAAKVLEDEDMGD